MPRHPFLLQNTPSSRQATGIVGYCGISGM